MTSLMHAMKPAALCLAMLVVVAPLASSQVNEMSPRAGTSSKKVHRIVVQVDSGERSKMNLALNNATNIEQFYRARGEKVEIEVVAFSDGLHMLRDDTSPVKDRLKAITAEMPTISFSACGNTLKKMLKSENKNVPLVSQAKLVESGAVRVVELQEQGWTYVKP